MIFMLERLVVGGDRLDVGLDGGGANPTSAFPGLPSVAQPFSQDRLSTNRLSPKAAATADHPRTFHLDGERRRDRRTSQAGRSSGVPDPAAKPRAARS
ncbi:hypothetical protein OHB05_00345 [Streptomyces sp. NBC_00638]|uniref:hypothetical protein n=1 Tax=unclassified Streptomyces TaxID=2593676 RepID=UPI00224EABCA|nr:hypothetical protein [Streptomyces sp. NBC_00638]MCX5001079.1 hypothetical protein [Streptomyces sp. NBC_00638]